MVIEETEKDHPFPGRVVVTGALPGYSAIGQVVGQGGVRDPHSAIGQVLGRGVLGS